MTWSYGESPCLRCHTSSAPFVASLPSSERFDFRFGLCFLLVLFPRGVCGELTSPPRRWEFVFPDSEKLQRSRWQTLKDAMHLRFQV